MAVLIDELKKWDESRVCAVLEQRRTHATTGAGNICMPRDGTPEYYPFDESKYPYSKKIASLQYPPWSDVLSCAPSDLVPVDPFAVSKFRPDGLQVWDAAIGIPTAMVRPRQVLSMRSLPTTRNINTLWRDTTIHNLSRVGNLGPDGEYLRPSGPYILDLMHSSDGWRMLEGAHALAHRVGEYKPKQWKKAVAYASQTMFHVPRFLAQMYVCKTYGLPLDVWCLNEGIKAEPDIVQYGIEIKSSSYMRTPTLRVPTMTNETPRLDATIAFVNVGIHIEPHPYGYNTGTGKWLELNRWSCSPTMLVISGWELVDVVTHQPLCVSDPDDAREPRCYGMNAADMQSADTFWAYLSAAVKHRGVPLVDNKRYWFVDDWLHSEDYAKAVGEAPPLPCRDCLRMNMRSEGVPRRPKHRCPDERSNDEKRLLKAGKLKYTAIELEWKAWAEQLDEVIKLIEKAVIFYEGRLHGHTEAMRIRRKRSINYRRRLTQIKEIQRLTDKIAKALKDGQPSIAAKLKKAHATLVSTMSGQEQ